MALGPVSCKSCGTAQHERKNQLFEATPGPTSDNTGPAMSLPIKGDRGNGARKLAGREEVKRNRKSWKDEPFRELEKRGRQEAGQKARKGKTK